MQFKTFDILVDIKRLLGRRMSLDTVVKATLGEGKSGHGLEAIKLFREGKMDELKSYCLDDVRLTRELFDFGVKNNKIHYPADFGDSEKKALHVQWGKYMDYGGDDSVSLTLPF